MYISTLEISAGQLKPFFHNRRGEILENMSSVAKYCYMEPVHWVASFNNPADLLTRGNVKLHDIGLDSMWQLGPKFLSLPREEWPVNRDCIDKSEKIPGDEKRSAGSYIRVLAVQADKSKSVISKMINTVETVLNFKSVVYAVYLVAMKEGYIKMTTIY